MLELSVTAGHRLLLTNHSHDALLTGVLIQITAHSDGGAGGGGIRDFDLPAFAANESRDLCEVTVGFEFSIDPTGIIWAINKSPIMTTLVMESSDGFKTTFPNIPPRQPHKIGVLNPTIIPKPATK